MTTTLVPVTSGDYSYIRLISQLPSLGRHRPMCLARDYRIYVARSIDSAARSTDLWLGLRLELGLSLWG